MLISGLVYACTHTTYMHTHPEKLAKGVFSSSNQSCCHPMAQPARMTLEAGTVRGTHGCQARNSQMGETKGVVG